MQLSSHCTASPAWVNAERGPICSMPMIMLQQLLELAKLGNNKAVGSRQSAQMQQDTKA